MTVEYIAPDLVAEVEDSRAGFFLAVGKYDLERDRGVLVFVDEVPALVAWLRGRFPEAF